MEAFPLNWPVGYPRTKYPQEARFKTSQHDAQNGLMRELDLLGADNIILSTNIPLRKDGLPYANWQKSLVNNRDFGVAVYFKYKGNQVVIACDKWTKLGDNMQAIRKTVEAMRGLERWGASDILNRVFTGFKALPQPKQREWYEVLGVHEFSSREHIKDTYREKAKILHPDKPTGSAAAFQELQEAYEKGIKYTAQI